MNKWQKAIVIGVVAGLIGCVAALGLVLLPLQYTAKGSVVFPCIVFSYIFRMVLVNCPIFLPVIFFIFTPTRAKRIRRLSHLAFVSVACYYATLLPILIAVPKWDRIVANTHDGYCEWKAMSEAKHGTSTRKNVFERDAELYRPIWEWLAK